MSQEERDSVRAFYIPPNTPAPTSTKPVHAFVTLRCFGLPTPSHGLLAATAQAAACDEINGRHIRS